MLLMVITHGISKFKLKKQGALFLKLMTNNDTSMTIRKEQATCLETQVEECALWGQAHL